MKAYSMPAASNIARLSIVRTWMDKALESSHGIKVEGMNGNEAKVYRQQFYVMRSKDAKLRREMKQGEGLGSAYDELVFRILDDGATIHIAKGSSVAENQYKITVLDEATEKEVLFQPELTTQRKS